MVFNPTPLYILQDPEGLELSNAIATYAKSNGPRMLIQFGDYFASSRESYPLVFKDKQLRRYYFEKCVEFVKKTTQERYVFEQAVYPDGNIFKPTGELTVSTDLLFVFKRKNLIGR